MFCVLRYQPQCVGQLHYFLQHVQLTKRAHNLSIGKEGIDVLGHYTLMFTMGVACSIPL